MNLFNRRKDRCEEYTVEIKPREGMYSQTGIQGPLVMGQSNESGQP